MKSNKNNGLKTAEKRREKIMLNGIEIFVVPVIVGIVYGVITLYKKVVDNAEKFLKWIPIIACALGAASGIIAFFAMPEIIPASNAFVAILIGGASGLAATGTNQIFKQLGKDDEKNGEDNTDDELNK
jgi:uncharacterized membrane protein